MATPSIAGSAQSYNNAASSVSHTLSSVVVPSGTDALVALVQLNSATAPSSVVFNGGEALTLLQGNVYSGTAMRTYLYELLNPTATTADLVVTLSGANYLTIQVIKLADVDTASPRGTIATTTNVFGTTQTVNVTSVADDLVVDFIAYETSGTIAADASQTEVVDDVPGIGSGGAALGRIGISTKVATTTSTAMSWTATASQRAAYIGVAYKGASSTTYPQNRGRSLGTGSIGMGNGFGYKRF